MPWTVSLASGKIRCFGEWSFAVVAAAVVLNFTTWFYPEYDPEDKNVGKCPTRSALITLLQQPWRQPQLAVQLEAHALTANLLLGSPSLGSFPDFAPRVPGSSVSC